MLARITALFFLLGALLSAQYNYNFGTVPVPAAAPGNNVVGVYAGESEDFVLFVDRNTGSKYSVVFRQVGGQNWPSLPLPVGARFGGSPTDLNRISSRGLYLKGYSTLAENAGSISLVHNGQIVSMSRDMDVVDISGGHTRVSIGFFASVNSTDGGALVDIVGTANGQPYSAIVETDFAGSNRLVARLDGNLFLMAGAWRSAIGVQAVAWAKPLLVPSAALESVRADSGTFVSQGIPVESYRLSIDPVKGNRYAVNRGEVIDLATGNRRGRLTDGASLADTVSDQMFLYVLRDVAGNITQVTNLVDGSILARRGKIGTPNVDIGDLTIGPPAVWGCRALIPLLAGDGTLVQLKEIRNCQ